MTDIVERLRAKGLPPPEILQEGAAEIERLRAALRAVLQVATDEYDGEPWQAIDLARRALEPKP